MSINHFQILVAKYGSASRLLNAVTRSCEETIFFCKLGVGVEIVGELCCRQNFKEPVYTTEGKCFGSAGKMEYRQVLKSQLLWIELMQAALPCQATWVDHWSHHGASPLRQS